MLLAAGLILLLSGLVSGAVLVLSPLGLMDVRAGWTTWFLFVTGTLAGTILAGLGSRKADLAALNRVTGGGLLLLAVGAALGLLGVATGKVELVGSGLTGGTLPLIVVLVFAGIAGALTFIGPDPASHKP